MGDASLFIAGALIGAVLFARFAPLTPLEEQAPARGTVVLDTHGVVLQRDLTNGIRIPVSLESIAPVVLDATVAAEDERFWGHPGVDPIATARAVLRSPWERSGASTITQQLARVLYLEQSGSPLPLRKAREAAIALQLEGRYSKRTILESYLNHVYYGRGAFGIEAAARAYFDVSARDLDLAQASFLAGLPQSPAVLGDGVNPSGSGKSRQRYVLDRLVATSRVSATRADEAAALELAFAPPDPAPIAQHFIGFVYDELARVRPDLASEPGLVIETTLDAYLQAEAERVVRLRLSEIADKHATNAAVVAMDPRTGAILTLVGGADFSAEDAGQVNMALQPRQPGSALKPLLYLAALERGYSAATPLLDIPSSFDTPRGVYAPRNYDGKFRGPVTLRTALASSLNVPAVRTLDALGQDALLEMAQRLGLDTLSSAEAYGLGLTLGVGEVRLLDLTAAYGALATQGALAEPYAIARIRDRHGRVVYEAEPPPLRSVLRAEHAFVVADVLSDSNARIPGFGRHSPLETSFGASVKTGTSDDSRDNWTVGFTGNRVVGVWVGNADGSPMLDISGVDGAGPIWRDVFNAANELAPVAPPPTPPAGLVRVTVCAPTGLLPGPHCQSRMDEWFLEGTEPLATETYYVRTDRGDIVANPPSEARAWSAEAGVRLSDAPADAGATAAAAYVVQPASGAVLLLTPELAESKAILRASVPAGATRVEFWVDGEWVGNASPRDARVVWALTVGAHELEVRVAMSDGSAIAATSNYEVREP